MGVTRLKRKDRKNKARANNKVARIKQLLSIPVIKNVDVEELKAQFNSSGKAAEAPATDAQETAVAPAKAPEAPAAGEANTDAVAAAEVETPVPGDVESPAERFIRNQSADTTAEPSQKEIDTMENLAEGEEDNIQA